MKDCVIVWVVDDSKIDASKAAKALEEAVRSVRKEPCPAIFLLWARDFTWPPLLRTSVDFKAPLQSELDYPDIVVLDLVQSEERDVLRGDDFYFSLRKWERSKLEGRPAFVLLWSFHQAMKVTKDFVAQITDLRVLPLATKRPSELRSNLAKVWIRVMEERENN